MGFFSPYSYKDQNKQKWWLHAKKKGKTTIFYFSKDQTGAMMGIPPGYELTVNKNSGVPLLRKRFKKEAKE